MSNDSFRPFGNAILVLTSSSTGQAAQQVSTGSATAAFLTNNSTIPVYVAFGTSSIAAGAPTTGTPAPGLCLPYNFGRVFNFGPANNWISAVTTAGSAILNAQPGAGI